MVLSYHRNVDPLGAFSISLCHRQNATPRSLEEAKRKVMVSHLC